MTNEELEELIKNCPTLFHMAERGSWAAIKERGLLSTSALLDAYGVTGSKRTDIEVKHRQTSISIKTETLPKAVLRDQMAMDDEGLEDCLLDDLKPSDWHKTLNSKVFFWLSEDRLHRLTGARAYREHEHDVIELDTASMIEAHYNKIWLCPINSGFTKQDPAKRGKGTFARIHDYRYHERKKRTTQERVVELCVDHSVTDIREHVKRVIVKKGKTELGIIEQR